MKKNGPTFQKGKKKLESFSLSDKLLMYCISDLFFFFFSKTSPLWNFKSKQRFLLILKLGELENVS